MVTRDNELIPPYCRVARECSENSVVLIMLIDNHVDVLGFYNY